MNRIPLNLRGIISRQSAISWEKKFTGICLEDLCHRFVFLNYGVVRHMDPFLPFFVRTLAVTYNDIPIFETAHFWDVRKAKYEHKYLALNSWKELSTVLVRFIYTHMAAYAYPCWLVLNISYCSITYLSIAPLLISTQLVATVYL